MLVLLKTQRRYLIMAAIGLLVICAALVTATIRAEAASETVPLGDGVASINVQPGPDVQDLRSAASQNEEPVLPEEPKSAEQAMGGGEASFYGARFAGRPTASGESFDPNAMTAAHRTLPFGSKVRVTNVNTGRSVVVRVNDRGPFHRSRVIDVSKAAARELGMVGSGKARVELALLL